MRYLLVKAVVVAQSEPKQAKARRQGPKTQRARAANRIAARALSRSPPLGGRRMHPSLGHRPQGFAPQLQRRGGAARRLRRGGRAARRARPDAGADREGARREGRCPAVLARKGKTE